MDKLFDIFRTTFGAILRTHFGTRWAQEGPRWAREDHLELQSTENQHLQKTLDDHTFFNFCVSPRPSKTASEGARAPKKHLDGSKTSERNLKMDSMFIICWTNFGTMLLCPGNLRTKIWWISRCVQRLFSVCIDFLHIAVSIFIPSHM